MQLKRPYQNFEQAFRLLLKEARKGPISVQMFLTILSGKGRVLLLIFLSLGLSQIPGICIVLGLFIAYLGVRIAIGKPFLWIPKRFRRKKMASYLLIKLINSTLKMLRFMKRWSHPRYEWATQKSTTRMINGSMIALVGLCLAISPPIPLTGLMASAAIFLISIGLLNDDGVYIILGYLAAIIYLVTVLLLLHYFSLTQIIEWFKNLF